MNACDEFIQNLQNWLPDAVSSKTLVSIGLFNSAQAVRNSRLSGDTPPYFRIGKRIMYPKKGVIEWLETKKCQ